MMQASLPESVVSPEEKRRAFDQALHSATFARADQLKRFLRYVCEMELAGRAGEITEYSIGTEALGKSSNYSPGDDSSVRSRAYALRSKLQEFYESENPEAAVRIEFHKGSYTPCFVLRAETPDLKPEVPDSRKSRSSRPGRPFLIFAAGFAAAALIAVLVWGIRDRQRTQPDPVLREAWGTMLAPGNETVVCLATPPALLLKAYRPDILPTGPHLMPVPGEVTAWYNGLHELDGGGDVYMQTTSNLVLMGDSLAAATAIRFLTSAGASIQVLPEPGIRQLALRGRNVLLIGSPNYSPYAGRILQKMPFSVRYDSVKKEEVIADGPAGAGAARVFRPQRDKFGQMTLAYGLITVVPSQSDGSGARTVIFSGITSAGPQAAMEFFSSASSMRFLKDQMTREGSRSFPVCYQVVVRCALDRALALNWTYEAHRTLEQPPLID